VTGGEGTRTAQARLRQEYRAFLRASHPDRGGDPDTFAVDLRRWQALLAGEAAQGRVAVVPEPGVTAFRRGSLPARFGRALTAALRRRRRTRVR
jgi:hypothetical protein